MPTDEAGQLTVKPQHTRTASLFSFSSKKSSQQHAQLAIRTTEQRSAPNNPVHSPTASTSTHAKRPSLGESGLASPSPGVQREIKSVVDLALAHAHKVYFSGPLIRRIERQPDGTRPVRDDGWVDIWAQLGGTTLSVWDMKAIEEASKRGEEVPPSYINVTDSFIQVLGALTSPPTATAPAKRYTNVITLNTAGSNLILLACPSPQALISWSSSLRLASWEKSRLEEIYTGHLLRMTFCEGGQWKEPASTLVKGKIEGQVKVRLAGQTDWKPLWMMISSSGDPANLNTTSMSRRLTLERTTSPTSLTRSKKRISNLFSRQEARPPPQLPGPSLPTIALYASNKSKDLKRPLLTMRYVSQVFAVYPERVEVISRSTLLKIEGLLGEEEMTGSMKGKQAWLMVMPETTQSQPVLELLKWLVALHDAFSLYGRPSGYVWDPRQPTSMWFAYPIGAQRAQLLLEREAAENLDPRDDRTSVIRKNLKQIVINRMYGPSPPPGTSSSSNDQPVAQLSQDKNPVTGSGSVDPQTQTIASEASNPSPQLPPLDFNGAQPQPTPGGSGQSSSQGQGAHRMPPISRGASNMLSTITERSPIGTGTPMPASPVDSSNQEVSISSPPSTQRPKPGHQSSQTSNRMLDEPPKKSPVSEAHVGFGGKLGSDDSYAGLRQDPKPTPSISHDSIGYDHPNGAAAGGQFPRILPENKPISQQTSSSSGFLSPTSASPSLSHPASSSSRLGSRVQSPTYEPNHSPHALSDITSVSVPGEPPQHSSPISNVQTVTSAAQSPFTPKSQMGPPPPPKGNTLPSFVTVGQKQPPRAGVSPPMDQEQNNDLASEAGALYLLQQEAEQEPPPQPPRETWSTSEDDEGQEESDPSGPERNPPPRRGGTPPILMQEGPRSASEFKPGSHVRSNLGRKPSGARAKPGLRRYPDKPPSFEAFSEQQVNSSTSPAMEPNNDDNADALAALTFLEQDEQSPKPPALVPEPVIQQAEPSPPPSETHHYPSSFAPSKQATERKAKAQAQQEATYAATHLPGKPNGKTRKKTTGAWAESSDEEEEEEDEDEDEEEGSEEEGPTQARQQKQPSPVSDPKVSVYPSAQPDFQDTPSVAGDHGQARPRTLPLPPNRVGGSSYDAQTPHSRVSSSQYDDRPRVYVTDEPKGHALTSHQAARQSVWSTVLDAQPQPRNASGRKDTFVQVDESETMTKAFQPHGLLSAGLQDKEDRSAKRQEELARETGGSLINVPNKPPPPQTGLLGAITAHERERNREGGVGAALTEKERERRLAEERQRKLDDLQRQQIDQLSQAGGQGMMYDAYGQQQFPGFGQVFDPRMSMNPMMLNPYMAGGFPMMPYGNPQQMMAAQLAAQQAYQHAMMSFGQAGGSQAGENMARAGVSAPGNATLSPMVPSPMMSPSPLPMQGGMMGMDPRMSMMTPMGMMMGGGMGMNPMMGVGMGMGMGMGMGQNLDPRTSIGQFNYLQRPDSRLGGASPVTPSLRQGSPAPPSPGNNSPRPQNTS